MRVECPACGASIAERALKRHRGSPPCNRRSFDHRMAKEGLVRCSHPSRFKLCVELGLRFAVAKIAWRRKYRKDGDRWDYGPLIIDLKKSHITHNRPIGSTHNHRTLWDANRDYTEGWYANLYVEPFVAKILMVPWLRTSLRHRILRWAIANPKVAQERVDEFFRCLATVRMLGYRQMNEYASTYAATFFPKGGDRDLDPEPTGEANSQSPGVRESC